MKKLYRKPEISLMALMITDVLWGSGDVVFDDWITGPGMDDGKL